MPRSNLILRYAFMPVMAATLILVGAVVSTQARESQSAISTKRFFHKSQPQQEGSDQEQTSAADAPERPDADVNEASPDDGDSQGDRQGGASRGSNPSVDGDFDADSPGGSGDGSNSGSGNSSVGGSENSSDGSANGSLNGSVNGRPNGSSDSQAGGGSGNGSGANAKGSSGGSYNGGSGGGSGDGADSRSGGSRGSRANGASGGGTSGQGRSRSAFPYFQPRSTDQGEVAQKPVASAGGQGRPYSLKEARRDLAKARELAEKNHDKEAYKLATSIVSQIKRNGYDHNAPSGQASESQEYQQIMQQALELAQVSAGQFGSSAATVKGMTVLKL